VALAVSDVEIAYPLRVGAELVCTETGYRYRVAAVLPRFSTGGRVFAPIVGHGEATTELIRERHTVEWYLDQRAASE
jgi:hypothetical protein